MASFMRNLSRNTKRPVARIVQLAHMRAISGDSIARAQGTTFDVSPMQSRLASSPCVNKCMSRREVASSSWFAAPGHTRCYAAGGEGAESAIEGNEEFLEPGQIAGEGRRFAVGSTSLGADELEGQAVDGEIKEKAKEALLEVGAELKDVESAGEIVEDGTVRKLQEKLVTTQGIGDLVQDMYNQKEQVFQAGAGGK